MSKEKPLDARKLAQEFDSLAAFLEFKLGERKARASGLTLRQFARACGLKSPAMVSMILHGTRLPSVATLETMAKVLKIGEQELAYLRVLLAFERAESEEERALHRAKLGYLRNAMSVATHGEEALLGSGHWYFPVLIELVDHPDFQDDPAWIAERLGGTVDERDVAAALAWLLEKKVLQRNAEGRIVGGTRDREWPGGNRSVAVRNYHREMLELARSALALDVDKRFVSGLTLSLDAEGYAITCAEITEFLRKAMARAQSAKGSEIHQLQIQLFPLTSRKP